MARALRLFVWCVPIVAYAWALARSERRGRDALPALGTAALGAAAFGPALAIERAVLDFTGIAPHARGATDLPSLVYAVLVASPLEQGLAVVAILPALRARKLANAADGAIFAAAAALGFSAAQSAHYLLVHAAEPIDLARPLLAAPAELALAAAWGLALGRDERKRLRSSSFEGTWLVATLAGGVHGRLAYGRGTGGPIAAGAMLAAIAALAPFFVRRALAPKTSGPAPSLAARALTSLGPPSLRAVRAALRRSERPVMLGWIAFGAVVTTGVMTVALTAAVVLGHRLGVDFAAADRVDGGPAAAAPLVLLGGAALASFPVAGFLTALASGTRSVLEPAMSAALAIAASLFLLGLAAPVAVVFAVAFAPIAFALACAGAFLGVER